MRNTYLEHKEHYTYQLLFINDRSFKDPWASNRDSGGIQHWLHQRDRCFGVSCMGLHKQKCVVRWHDSKSLDFLANSMWRSASKRVRSIAADKWRMRNYGSNVLLSRIDRRRRRLASKLETATKSKENECLNEHVDYTWYFLYIVYISYISLHPPSHPIHIINEVCRSSKKKDRRYHYISLSHYEYIRSLATVVASIDRSL